ncbi:MAG: hypothetical protein GQ531_10420 [Sulfurovum sp.]|nr:hypothetical protein [Sulfurovum sp.]
MPVKVIVKKIQNLTIPNNYYIQYQSSPNDLDIRLVFSIYYDATSMVNDYEGRVADYILVVDGEDGTLEFFDNYTNKDFIQDGGIDDYYFTFPQI